MSKYRKGRINDAVAQELAIAIRELTDPRIVDRLVSITRAEVAPDLKIAKVYFSCISDEKEVAKVLKGASGALRRALAERLNLRITPELIFCYDQSMEHGARIAELLEQIHASDSHPAEDDE
ncbi:MAG: 30S ribosome-binding factor RbfA [Clostridia bacterium]|nr:30S ribosome-binding factor RbfA [Clostridia bacterium]